MHFKNLLLAAVAASTASAAAIRRTNLGHFAAPRAVKPLHHGGGGNSTNSTSSSGFQQVVYWGQNDAEKDLANYCQQSEGIDILVLAFLDQYGNGKSPSGNFGSQCSTGQTCSSLEKDVQTCKQAGKKVFVSLGGATGAGQINSQSDGEQLAQDLWNSYGGGKGSNRPLGSAVVDGFDLDIESNHNNDNYKYLINKLRDLFAQDSKNKYYISGAPQCPIPEPNMGSMIQAAQFDMLFIQFYNNPCSANDASAFNFDDWSGYVAKGASKGAKLFVGLPASPNGATGTESGAKYYLQPSALATLVNKYKSHAGFSGVMLWDAGNSDSVNENGCHYSGEVRSVLDKGKTC